eukprot:Blabericola_migrator_1__9575@NODE_521_length_7888_cov_123_152538_g398_i0_p8_GENE_NODE_521_length_7888_cov_123_152538_g398_i0NODE_521_length_7888_cov_123_152538_g398_i0_p8_ORF_typecomplete_len116_score2_67_NODE_521_length_7888_cov_123_152538_g398_i013471694
MTASTSLSGSMSCSFSLHSYVLVDVELTSGGLNVGGPSAPYKRPVIGSFVHSISTGCIREPLTAITFGNTGVRLLAMTSMDSASFIRLSRSRSCRKAEGSKCQCKGKRDDSSDES